MIQKLESNLRKVAKENNHCREFVLRILGRECVNVGLLNHNLCPSTKVFKGLLVREFSKYGQYLDYRRTVVMNQRTLTVGGSITVRLVSSFTRLH